MKEFEGTTSVDATHGVVRLARSIYHHVGSAPLVLRRPTRFSVLWVFGESGGPWRIKIGDYAPRIFTADAGTDQGTVAGGHQYDAVDGPFFVSSTGALPGGLAVNTRYWVRTDTATTFWFHVSYQDAVSGQNRVDITSAGSGTHTIGGLSAAAPTASDTVGMGSVRLAVGSWYTVIAPARLTIAGTAAGDVLTYYWT